MQMGARLYQSLKCIKISTMKLLLSFIFLAAYLAVANGQQNPLRLGLVENPPQDVAKGPPMQCG